MTGADLAALDAQHATNVARHGRSRADMARWSALLTLSAYLCRAEGRRRERAMLEAIDALERARAAEEGEARWVRVSTWAARRVDACAARLARRTLEVQDLATDDEDGIAW